MYEFLTENKTFLLHRIMFVEVSHHDLQAWHFAASQTDYRYFVPVLYLKGPTSKCFQPSRVEFEFEFQLCHCRSAPERPFFFPLFFLDPADRGDGRTSAAAIKAPLLVVP